MRIISLDVTGCGLCHSDYVSHWIMSVTGLCQSLDYVSHWIMSVTGLCQLLGYIGFGFPFFWILDLYDRFSYLFPGSTTYVPTCS